MNTIVNEFQTAVESKSASSLRYQLKLERRLDDDERKGDALRMLAALKNLSKFQDWKSLVNDSYHDEIEKAIGGPEELLAKPGSLPEEGIYYDVEASAVQAYFQTDYEKGLSSSDIPPRIAKYGLNTLPAPPKPSYLKMLWDQATDFMVLILLAAAAVSAGLGDYKATVVLVVVVVLNTLIGFIQEYKAEKALASLMSLSVPQAVVIRDSKQSIVPSQELVPGDVVVLDEGAAIPADLRLFEVAQLHINEAILTGESLPVEKKTPPIHAKIRNVPIGDRINMAFMSTAVTKGRGKGIVVSSGSATEVGKISGALAQASISASKTKTPLQQKLGVLGKWLVLISIVLCGAVVGIGVGRKKDALEMVKVGISLAVSVIPEGLVAVVTITMALGVQRMARRHAIVRKLPSVETLGSVTTICSDKTGTLTEGKMKAEIIWVDGETYSFTGSGDKPDDGTAVSADGKEIGQNPAAVPPRLRSGLMVSALCNNATVTRAEPGGEAEWNLVGDPTEIALVVAAIKAGVQRDYWVNTYGIRTVCEFAFDSDRKRMSVIYEVKENIGIEGASPPCIVMAKGASEAILKGCTQYASYSSTGEMVFNPMDDTIAAKIEEQGGVMASQGLRVIALAVRPLTLDQATLLKESNDSSACERDLALVGLIGLIDPPRREVKDSIRMCHEAGIRVCMITGDHAATATAIAKSLGILDEKQPTDGLVLRGEQLDLYPYTDENLAEINPFPLVFARVSPDNKFKIVKALQARGEVAAMTGDGVNDAPAIKQANVGLAMGQAGTEITKQAAAIVLADDNFATIVVAVEEGRRIFDNISKFILYLLSCNTAEIVIMLLSVIINTDYVPFTPIMILWANLVVDIPPSLSLGLEPAEADIMLRKPRNPKKGVFSVSTAIILLIQGFSMSLIALTVFLLAYYVEDGYEPKHTSVFKTGIMGNKLLIYANLLSATLLVAGVYIPGLNDLLELVPLEGKDWGKIFAAILVHLVVVEIEKFIIRELVPRKKPSKMAVAMDVI